MAASSANGSDPAAFCPNIGRVGRLRRLRVGVFGAFTSVLMLAIFLLLRVPTSWRLVLFLPAMASAISWLEATRHTCVYMAARGREEDEVGRSHPVEALRAAASRLMARTIWRDAFLIGLGASLIGVASAWIR